MEALVKNMNYCLAYNKANVSSQKLVKFRQTSNLSSGWRQQLVKAYYRRAIRHNQAAGTCLGPPRALLLTLYHFCLPLPSGLSLIDLHSVEPAGSGHCRLHFHNSYRILAEILDPFGLPREINCAKPKCEPNSFRIFVSKAYWSP